jgi:manganese transport protein
MDPGNWATDIAGGSAFGYSLLSVILISNLLAVLFQSLSARLGIATGLDLAQACRHHYPKPVNIALWLLCEIAIVACDVAEIIGTAIALKLLFGLPLLPGICLTVFDTLIVLMLQNRGFRYLEAAIIALMLIIAGCFFNEIAMAKPEWSALFAGYVPRMEIVHNPEMLLIAIGILGATVMPHNLYLHSAIVQTRAYGETSQAKREAIKFSTIDAVVALTLALFVNSAILIMGAAVFHASGQTSIGSIEEAHRLLAPLLGTTLAGTLFALALLASGQNSTITATMAGQIVMEGFMNIRLKPWLRRLVTRTAALIPSLLVCGYYGEQATGMLLVLSQVVLSLQLPFAVVPLVQFTSSRLMGPYRPSLPGRVTAWCAAVLVIALNVKLLTGFLPG